jgi:hypothetical protein
MPTRIIFANLLAVIFPTSLKVCYPVVIPHVLPTIRIWMTRLAQLEAIDMMCIEDGAKEYLPKLWKKRPPVPGWNDSARALCS